MHQFVSRKLFQSAPATMPLRRRPSRPGRAPVGGGQPLVDAITKLYAPDVREIRSLNIARSQVPQEGEGYNILLQDVRGESHIPPRVGGMRRTLQPGVAAMMKRNQPLA